MKKLFVVFMLLSIIACDFDSDFIDNNFRASSMDELISVELIEQYDNTKLLVEIANNSDKEISIFRPDLPSDFLGKDLFDIEHDSLQIDYVGKLAVYRQDDWFILQAGYTYLFKTDLSNGYEFPIEGDYSIYYSSYVTIKRETGEVEAHYVTSPKFVIDIIEPVFYRFAATPACNSSQKSKANAGMNHAKGKTQNAINYLAAKGQDSYYVKWFGAKNTTRFNKIKTGFNKIKDAINRNTTHLCASSCDGFAAFVYKGRPYEINWCGSYIERASAANIGETGIHEASHWNVVMSTDDHVYGKSGSMNLAKNSPEKAISNADNVCFYPYDIPNAPSGPVDPPVEPPVDPPDNNVLVSLYQHNNYQGYEVKLKIVRNYNLGRLINKGMKNDDISSIKVAQGYEAILFENSDFKGVSHVIKSNISSLRSLNFNDMLSSIKVRKSGDTPPNPEGGPAGYTRCADENQSFNVPGICNVAYGAKGVFVYKYNVSGTIKFDNATFGDPIVGVRKAGYYKQVSNEPPPGQDTLLTGKSMNPGEGLLSANGAYRFWFQRDGHLVIRSVNENGKVLWVGGAPNKGATILWMQGDGNLVLYNANNNALWATGTYGTKAKMLQMLGSGQLVIKGTNDNIIWSVPDTVEPPGTDPTGPWKFVVAGDTRSNDSAHRSVLRAVKNNTSDYELYINSGDVVADGSVSSQWNTFTNACNSVLGSNWKNKYLACPGNHDRVNGSGLSNWHRYLPKQAAYGKAGKYFKYVHKNVTFYILDADGNKDTQANFIRNNKPNTTWVFAVWHYANSYSQWLSALNSVKFDGIFHGHNHIYKRMEKGSYFQTIVGTGGAPLGSGAVYGYLECQVNGNRITVKYIKASNGQVLDSKTYTANNK